MRQTAIVRHVGPGGASIEIGGTVVHSALLANTVPANDLHVGDLVSVQWVDGKPHVTAILTWRGEYHAVPEEAGPEVIVSYEEGGEGVTVHGELLGLEEDDHGQYVHTNLARVIAAQHTFLPTTEMAPFALGETAQGQLVIGLRADQLNKSVLAGNGLTGGGLLTGDVTLHLNTPGTLSYSTTNNPGGNHTHQILAQSKVNDGSTALLMATAGELAVKELGVGGVPGEGYVLKVGGNQDLEGNLVFTGVSREIQTSTGDLYLAPAGKTQSSKDLTFTGYNRVSEAYVSGAFGAGYAIGHTSAMGSYLEVDNVTVRGSLRTHIFQYDVVRATNGYLYIADATEITYPAEGSYIFLKHPVFHTGDLLWYKDFDLGSSQLISQVKMTVTSENTQVVKNGQTVYRYTVTVNDGSLADLDAGGTVVRVGGSAQDRQGAVYIDAASQFSPFLDVYAGVASWADFHSPSKAKSRFGRLDGITSGTNEYGLLAGSGIADTDKYLRLSNVMARINNIPVRVFKDGNAVIVLDPDAPYLGVGAVAPTTWLGAPGFWTGLHGGAYKTYIGDNDGARLQFDGTALGIYDANNEAVFSASPAGTWMSALMVSETLGQFIFNQADGIFLWGPYGELASNKWVSSRGHAAAITGAFRALQGRWAGTRALQLSYATINYCYNPVFGAINTNYWFDYTQAGTSGTRWLSTDWASYGTHSYRISKSTGGTNNFGVYCQVEAAHLAHFVAGNYVTFSVDLNAPSGTRVGWMAYVDDGGIVKSDSRYVNGPFIGRVVATVGPLESGTHEYIRGYVWVESDTGTVYVDGAQIQRTSYAMPLCVGDMGRDYSWDGTPHASRSISGYTNLSLDNFAPMMNGKSQFAVRTLFQAPYSSADMPDRSAIWDIYGGSDSARIFACLFDNNQPRLYINGAYRTYPDSLTFSAGDWIDMVVNIDFDAPLFRIYINGQQWATATTAGLTPGSYSTWRVGSYATGGGHRGLRIQEYAVFGRTLTPDEIAALAALQRPLVDAATMSQPGIWILDGRFTIASGTSDTRLELNSQRLAIGDGISYSGVGCWLGLDAGTPKFSLYKDSSNYFLWNGSALEWKGAYTSLSAAGALTCTSGTVGGWSITTNQIRSANSRIVLNSTESGVTPAIYIGGSSFGSTAGIQLEYNGGSPRAYIGNGSNAYLKYTTNSLEIVSGGGAIKITNAANILFAVNNENQGLAWFTDSNFTTATGYINMSKAGALMTLATGGGGISEKRDFRIVTESSSGAFTPLYISANYKTISIYDGGSGAPDGRATLAIRNNNDGTWAVIYAQQWTNRAVAHFDQDYSGAPVIRLDGDTVAAGSRTQAGYVRINVNGSNYWLPYYS